MSEPESIESIARRFWSSTSDYGTQPPLTDESVAKSEALLDVVLPADYLALLRERNGGVVSESFSAFMTTQLTSWADDQVPFEECMGIGEKTDDSTTINDSRYLNGEWGQPERLVLLSGDGHFWIALDYRDRNAPEPSVVWFDNDEGEDVRLAETFGEFVRQLTAPPPFDDD